MITMKKTPLTLLFSFLISGTSLMAQPYQGLVHSPTDDELKRESLFGPSMNAQTGNTSLKPTADKQRLIASIITNDTTGAMMLRDTALFTYSGLRGSGPSGPSGNITVLSDYDTSYAYTSTDNFTNPSPRSSRKYDAEGKLLFSYNYAPSSEVILRSWYEYYDTDTIKKAGTWRMFNATDYSYKETQYNAAGKILVDTFSQVVPSIPGPAYNADRTYKNTYDAQNRWISGTRKNNGYDANGNVTYGSDYSVWLFYDNATQTLPVRDSSTLVFYSAPQNLNVLQTYYTYDASGNLLQAITYTGNSQVVYSKVINVYNAGGKVLSTLSEYYINGQISDATKTENQYDNNVLTSSIYTTWNSGTNVWTEQSKTIYHLNDQYLVDSMAFYNSALINTTTYTYNSFKNIVEQKQISYDNNNVAHTSVTHNYYELFDDGTQQTGVGNVNSDDLKVSMFPNPASGYIDIHIQNWKGAATITISNMNGTVLEKSEINNAHARLDLSSYTAGLYTISISSKEGTSIKKIVKH